MFQCNDSVPKTFMVDTTLQGLAGQSYTYFSNDKTGPPTPEMLHRAAMKGDAELLKRVLDAGISVDCRDTEGTSALILACRYNQYDCAKLLLEYGANPSAQRKDGSSALCYAAYGGYLPMVKLLIQLGADVQACGLDGASPFLLACQCNYLDVAQELIANNPEYEKEMIESTTPMYVAAQNGHASIIQFLISRGADINKQRRIPPKTPDSPPATNGTTPLFVACQYGHTGLVKKMVEWGADVNLNRDDGCSPLLKASHKGFTNIVKFLLSKGAFSGLLTNGEAPLHAAAYYGHLTVLKALVEHGVDVYLRDQNGLTALAKAQEGDHQIVIRYLARIMTEKNSTKNSSANQV
ncbi:ankyrin repeat domain-containing protein 29 [Nephila pilipes]|uniref:Ankyrin repeat domain-containing protein 29 n=1 Tax=Nephila pilipes TaxID=299642 RepID=A0A8X6PZY4_NEPPI|nr:ankyrin repeat domain-containing protein 29 [Nephila pilipes]